MSDETATHATPVSKAEASAEVGAALLMQSKVQSEVQDELEDCARPFPQPVSDGSPLAGLPMQLTVTVPIPGFRVQDLLALEKGAVLESRWPHAEDVPVWCGGVQLVWAEFEVVELQLAVRVTRLG